MGKFSHVKTCLHAAQFTDAYKPVVDGVVGVVANYASMIHEHHGRSVVVAPVQKDAPLNEDFPVLRFPSISVSRSSGYRMSITPELALHNMHRLTETPIDIIHAHSPFGMGELALKIGQMKHVPVVCTFHSQYRDDFLNVTGSRFLAELGVEYLVRRFWNRVPYVMVPTEFSGRILRDYGWEGEYRVQPNGTDMVLPSAGDMVRYHRAGGLLLDVPDSLPVLLFVGQHRWVKNTALIIDAAAILKNHGFDFLQVFIGGGRDEEAIRQYAEKAGVSERTRFLGVIQDRNILSRYFARADLFTFPSTYDVDPLVVKEAAAWGTPSVVARGSSSAERIIDNRNGFLTPAEPAAMASLIRQILARKGFAAAVGKEAQRTVYLSREAAAENLVSSYYEIIDDWRAVTWRKNLIEVPPRASGRQSVLKHRGKVTKKRPPL